MTASTGNHGAASAWAAKRLGLSAMVFAPQGASRSKLALIESLGGEILVCGSDLDESKAQARRFASERGAPFFEDGAESEQYAGYGAIADEILAQTGRAPFAILAPVGNGALIGGIGEVLRRRGAATQLIGVAARDAPVMALSFEAGRPVDCDRIATFADGLAVRVAVPRAVEVLRRVVSRILLVSEREIAGAVGAYAAAGIRVEGAAAAPLAALAQLPEISGPIVLLVTGRNIDDELYTRVLRSPDSFPT